MYVHGLTPLGGALVSAGVPILGGRPTVAGGGSSYGPAFLLGGSTADFSQGLYNSLSTLLNAGGTRLSAGTPTRSSAYQEQRAKTLDLAASLIDVGNTRAGRAKAEELLDKNANDVGALHLIAHSYVAEQEYEQAERYYSRAFALAPSSARLKSDLANARALQKGNDEVLAEGRRKIQSPAQRTEGLRLLLHLSDRDPNNADIFLALADGYAAARQPMEVLGALQEAVKLADDSQIDEVIQKAKKLVEQYPDVGMPHNILGRALQKAGRLHEAFTELKAASTIAPNNFGYTQDLAGAYVARAQGKLAAGDVISARTDLQTAQGLDPANGGLSEGFARVAAYRAEQAVVTGRFTAALTELATASSKAPDDEQFKRKLASLYIRVGGHYQSIDERGSALTAYRKAYELDPTSALARRYVGQLGYEEGLEAIGRTDYDGAIAHLDRAYQAYRTNDTYKQALANAYDLRGQLSMALGKYTDALEDFKKGFDLDPSNASLNTHLSEAINAGSGT